MAAQLSMYVRAIASFIPSFILLLSVVVAGCNDVPQDPDSDTTDEDVNTSDSSMVDTTDVIDTVDIDSSSLAKDGTTFLMTLQTSFGDPINRSVLEYPALTVRRIPIQLGGRTAYHHYLIDYQGFDYSLYGDSTVDRIFHGSVVEETNGDISFYYSDNMQGNQLWDFSTWLRYPVAGPRVAGIVYDSTDSQGNRQRIDWIAERKASDSIVVNIDSGLVYDRTVYGFWISWEMDATLSNAGVVTLNLEYKGEDFWVPELAMVCKRRVEAIRGGELDHMSDMSVVQVRRPY